MAGSSLIGNLAVNLTMETAAFQRGASQAEARAKTLHGRLAGLGSTMKGFGAGLVGGLGVGLVTAGLGSIASSAFRMGSELSEASEKMGVTVEGLQRLRVAARETGVSNEQLDSAMAKLNKSLGGLQLGTKAAVDAFAQIGLSADDLKGKRPDEALRLIADALNKLPDPQQRIAIGSQLMGKGFAQLVPLINGGSAALDKYAAQSKRSGEVSDENARKLDELADRWEGFKVTVGVAAANMIGAIAKLSGSVVDSVNKWYAFRDGVVQSVQAAVNAVINMVSQIANHMGGRLTGVLNNAKARVREVTAMFEDMYNKVTRNSYVPDMVSDIAQEFARLATIMVDPAVSATDKVAAAFQTLQGAIAGILGKKAGGIFNMISGMAASFAPLLGGLFKGGYNGGIGAGTDVTSSAIYSGVPGFARGGNGIFGGMAGVDRNVLSLNGSPIARVSRGERFNVAPANGNGGGSVVSLRLDSSMLQAEIAHGANVQIVRAAPLIQSSAVQAVQQRNRRR